MDEEWIVDRSRLKELWFEHPNWSRQKMANEMERSKSWVKKWLHRIRSVSLDDQTVLRGKSHIRKHPPTPLDPKIVEKILEIRVIRRNNLDAFPDHFPFCIISKKTPNSKKQNPSYRVPPEPFGKFSENINASINP